MDFRLTGAPVHEKDHGAVAGTAFRVVLGIVLLIAGGLKITDLEQSAKAVKAYKVMPPAVAEVVGYALPPLEMFLGLLLVIGLFTRVAATIAGLLMVVFIVGIISVWVRGISIECGCFNAGGASASPIDVQQWEYLREIIRDLVLLGLAAWLAVWPRTRWALDTIARPHLHKVYEFMDDDDPQDAPADALAPEPAGVTPRPSNS
jgi:uncharacterized membrane protein YphA (DoxX/SURF4 family)